MPPMAPTTYLLFQMLSLLATGFLFGVGFHFAGRLISKAK